MSDDRPRLLAQPPILPSGDWSATGPSVVERATAVILEDQELSGLHMNGTTRL